jgi:catechol 2,3-dioxygenase-like lactoylglutathione lyase family enzyme
MNLSDSKVGAAVAVSDMEQAKQFYEGKLGLTDGEDTSDGGRTYSCGGDTTLHVFPSPNARASGATQLGWDVDDLEATVDELISKGVTFEQYDQGPIKTDEKGIATFEDGKVAYLKDPEGNVMALGAVL